MQHRLFLIAIVTGSFEPIAACSCPAAFPQCFTDGDCGLAACATTQCTWQLNTNYVSRCADGTGATCTRSAASSGCLESCTYASDGTCDDGGPGAAYASCALGTDCTDCGVRVMPSPPPPPPTQSASPPPMPTPPLPMTAPPPLASAKIPGRQLQAVSSAAAACNQAAAMYNQAPYSTGGAAYDSACTSAASGISASYSSYASMPGCNLNLNAFSGVTTCSAFSTAYSTLCSSLTSCMPSATGGSTGVSTTTTTTGSSGTTTSTTSSTGSSSTTGSATISSMGGSSMASPPPPDYSSGYSAGVPPSSSPPPLDYGSGALGPMPTLAFMALGNGFCRDSNFDNPWTSTSSCMSTVDDCMSACFRVTCACFSYAEAPADNFDGCQDAGIGRCNIYIGPEVATRTSAREFESESQSGSEYESFARTNFNDIPAGCGATSNNETVPGYPDPRQWWNVEQNSMTSIFEVNCSTPCQTLASEVDSDHTWLGFFVMSFLVLWPLYSLPQSNGKRPPYSTLVPIGLGWLNAVIMSFRLFGHMTAALSDPICIWPHPFQDGVLIFESGWWIWSAVATSVATASIMKAGVLTPVGLYLSVYGLEAQNGKFFMGMMLLSIAPVTILIFSAPIVVMFALVYAMLVGPMIFVQLPIRMLANSMAMRISKCLAERKGDRDKWPVWLAHADELGFKLGCCAECEDNNQAPSRAQPCGDPDRPRPKGYFKWFGVSTGITLICLMITPVMKAALVMLPYSPSFIDVVVWFAFRNPGSAFTGTAYRDFFATIAIPNFVWLELWADYATINGQLAIATGLDLIVIIGNSVPCVRSSPRDDASLRGVSV